MDNLSELSDQNPTLVDEDEESSSVSENSDKYESLDEKTVRTWRKDPSLNKNLDYDQAHSKRRQSRKITAPFYTEELELVNKIKERRENKEAVSRDWIISKAKRLIQNSNFRASAGWFSNFKRSWKLSRRVATQKLSDTYYNQLKDHLEQIRRYRYDQEEKKGLSLVIGNMDETCLKFNMSNGRTYDFQG